MASGRTSRSAPKKIYAGLPKESRDAFYQLVLYPTKGSAVVNERFIIAVAKEPRPRKQNDPRRMILPSGRELFAEDQAMSDYYNNTLAGGKWKHMMDQTRIGYTGWQHHLKNVIPQVVEVAAAIEHRASGNPVCQPENKRTEAVWRSQNHGAASSSRTVTFSIEAEHFTRKTDTSAARWEVLPDHWQHSFCDDHFPVTAPSVTCPRTMLLRSNSRCGSQHRRAEVTTILSPALNFAPERGVRLAVSF